MAAERSTRLVPVALVGAGPGDPGLITVSGAKLLERAEVVVYDRLANPALLKLAPPSAELIDVGKSAGSHPVGQNEINSLLVRLGRTGKRIVRLKGGDPFVFGRGGEEAEALADANVPFVVVPGVTSGVAAPTYAGIPVTHRGLASTFTVATGHEQPGKADSGLDFAALARLDSVAFYMSVGTLAQNAAALIANGKNPKTPAAVIERGAWPQQRVIVAPLDEIAASAAAAGVKPPALVFVGPTVALREKLNWFERQPLFGLTVAVTRTRQQASQLSAGLAELGASVIEAPTIRIEPPQDWRPIDEELRRLGDYDWLVFTSPNGVTAWAARMRELGLDGRTIGRARVAAIGTATAAALDAIFIRPDLVPDEYVSESLAEAIRSLGDLRASRFLLLRADIARPALNQSLAAAGAEVVDCAIYRTLSADSLPPQLIEAASAGRLDWITFTSSSAVRNFFELADDATRQAVIAGLVRSAVIGPATAEQFKHHAARPPDAIAREHTITALIETIAAATSTRIQ